MSLASRSAASRAWRKWFPFTWAALALVLLEACGGRATTGDCVFTFDRLVDLQLEKRGFRDPVLRELKRQELRRILGAEIAKCEGHRFPRGARQCMMRASSSSEIIDRCLRAR